jgi:hypothetical protein
LENGPILTVSAESLQKALEPFFDLGHKSTPLAGKKPLSPPRAQNDQNSGLRANSGVIAKVKASWPILSYLAFFEPTLRIEGRGGEWRSALCPWHNDHNPSLRINIVTNTWRCFACGAFGDVVNWHALRGNFPDQGEAAKDLARYEIQVGL